MREALLVAIVVVLCGVALVRPRVGLYGWVWFALMRPEVLAWSYLPYYGLSYSEALAICTLVGSIPFYRRIATLLANPIARGLLLLQLPIGISVLTAYLPSLSSEPFLAYERMVIMVLMVPVLIQSERSLRVLLLVMAASLGILSAKFGLFGLLQGGVRFAAGYGGMLADNNCVALAFAMAVPLCWYARSLVSSQWARLAFGGMAFTAATTVVMTYSRGGAVSLVVAMLVIAYHARRRFLALCAISALVFPAVYLVRGSYFERLETLKNPDEESSAYRRIVYANGAIAMWRDYPLFGVGFGGKNQMQLQKRYADNWWDREPSVIHNTYLEFLAGSGVFAGALYVILLFGAIIWLGLAIRRARRELPGSEVYPIAIQTSLITFAVGSSFLSREQFDLMYVLLMGAAAWYSLHAVPVPSRVAPDLVVAGPSVAEAGFKA